MKASVIVPVRNGGAALRRCIEALLRQDFPRGDRDIWVVDNGSTDQTAETIKEYPVRGLYEPRPGSYRARNRALPHVRGDIVAFTDADCEPADDWLSQLAATFDEPAVAGCGGSIADSDPRGWIQEFSNRHILRQDVALSPGAKPYPYAIGANMAWRKSVLDAMGAFDERLISGGDADLSWRAQQAGHRVVYVPEARVRHYHRASLRGLLKQAFRFGIGIHCLIRKHGGELDLGEYRFPAARRAKRCVEKYALLGWMCCNGKAERWQKKDMFLDATRQAALTAGLAAGKVMYFRKF